MRYQLILFLLAGFTTLITVAAPFPGQLQPGQLQPGQLQLAEETSTGLGTCKVEPTWWEKRHERADIYFPHQAHMNIMEARGDVCMACHPFTGTPKTNINDQVILTALANEPLEAICHECHMVERSAPLACVICHTDIDKVRPVDHGYDYTNYHAAATQQNEAACRSCHIEMSFCTDCHFRRNSGNRVNHLLGYRDRHGLDARLDTASCGRCHNTAYCRDCHRGQ